MLAACCLPLAAWSLEPVALRVFQPFEELFTAGQVTGRQRAMVLSEPWQQVIVFNSFSFHTFPYPALLVEGSLPAHLLFSPVEIDLYLCLVVS